jgi:hypothetical protein
MRALVVFFALAVSVAVCVAFLVYVAGIHLEPDLLLTLCLGLLMVAGLFAAISAIGPKYAPTPILTPTIAGAAAAVAATVLVIVANTQLEHDARRATGSPPAPTAAAPGPAAPPLAAIPPEDLAPPPVSESPPARSVEPPTGMTDDFPEGDISTAPEDAEPEAAPETPPADTAAGTPSKPATIIPIPRFAPREPSSGTLNFDEDSFDTSAAPAGGNRSAMATPPRPRSRPCGGAWPACP